MGLQSEGRAQGSGGENLQSQVGGQGFHITKGVDYTKVFSSVIVRFSYTFVYSFGLLCYLISLWIKWMLS